MSNPPAAGLAKGKSEVLELRVGPPRDALDRFEAAWNRVAEGRPAPVLRVLTLRDLPLLLRTLTPARWALLERLAKHGPLPVYQLAKRLERDYKNVHTDVAQLARLGLIERRAGGVAVAWNKVRAELALG
jgi:predicted transcriptional regulator